MTPLLAQRPRADRAFERLYQEHVHPVYRYALAVLHNEADAEDVTQTTFLSAYRAFQGGQRPERPHNWLIKIAHNVCRQRFRDSSRRPQEVAFDESVAVAASDDRDIPSAGEIRRALGFLGFNQRAALVMREMEGRSYAEIAQILDVSVGAVETLIFRARRALREQLEGGLTCEEAELTLSRLHQRLSTDERGSLRAHLRECKECAVLERRQRAQRAAIKGLGAVPLPASLGSFFGAGGAATGGAALGGLGIGAKIAAVLAAGLIASGVGHEAVKAVAAKDKAPATSNNGLPQARDSAASTTRPGQVSGKGQSAKTSDVSFVQRALGRPSHRFKATPHAGAGAAHIGSPAAASSATPPAVVQNTVTPVVSKVPRPVAPPPVSIPPVTTPPVNLPPLPVTPPVHIPPVPPVPPVTLPPPPKLP